MFKTILFSLIILNLIQQTQQGRRKLSKQPSFLPGIPEQQPQTGAVLVHKRLNSTQPRQLQKLERYVQKKNEQGQGLLVKSKEIERELIQRVNEENFNKFQAKLQRFLQQMYRFLLEIEAKVQKNMSSKSAIKILHKLQSIKLKILRRNEVMEAQLTSSLHRVRQKSVMQKYGPVAGPYRLLQQKQTTQMLQLMKAVHPTLSLKLNQFLEQKSQTLLDKVKQTLRELNKDIAAQLQNLQSGNYLIDSLKDIRKDLQKARQTLENELVTSIQPEIQRLRKAKAAQAAEATEAIKSTEAARATKLAKSTKSTEASAAKDQSPKKSGLRVRKDSVSYNQAFRINFPQVEKIEVRFGDRWKQLQTIESKLDRLMEAGSKNKSEILQLLHDSERLESQIVRDKSKLRKAFRYSPEGLQEEVLEIVERMVDRKQKSLMAGLKGQFAKVEVMLTYAKRLKKTVLF